MLVFLLILKKYSLNELAVCLYSISELLLNGNFILALILLLKQFIYNFPLIFRIIFIKFFFKIFFVLNI